MKRPLIFILVSLATSLVFASSNSTFVNYNSGNFNLVRNPLINLAKQNNPQALYYIGIMYMNGFGIKKNFDEGLDMMMRSSKLNYLPALIYLGKYYFFDKKDIASALPWFQKAARKDDTNAQLFVMLAYVYGYGTKRNEDKANWSTIQVAKKGNAMAQYELGRMFLASKYKSNHDLGLIWLKKSAAQNYQKAVELLNNPTNTETPSQTNTAVDKHSEYQLMKQALLEAKSTLGDRKVVLVKDGEQMTTPHLILLTKNMVIQPNYNLLIPKDIPIEKISSIILHKNYLKEKPHLEFPKEAFNLPVGTTNQNEAFQKLYKQSQFGDPMVLYKLGQMYAKGLSVKQDYNKAFEYFMASARQGYIRAQYEIGIYYLQKKVVPINTAEAIKWLTRAALRGSPQAQFVLGMIYEYGINHHGEKGYIKRDVFQSKALYTISSLQNIPEAQYRLAKLYASGMLNPNHDFATERSNQREAYLLFKNTGKKGIVNPKVDLAFLEAAFNNNKEALKNLFKTIRDKAVEGNSTALLLTAILYDRGIGVSKNQSEAMDILENLSKQGDAIAQFMLGTYKYLNDNNKQQAILWLKKSANQNNPYAQYNLALLIEKNVYHPADETFVSLLKKSAENHFPGADILLADHYLMQNANKASIKEAVDIYQKLAEKQNSTAQLKLGFMYQHGIYFTQNDTKASEFYIQAAKNKNPIAQYLLGRMYQTGVGTTQNINYAMYYYRLAANKNYIPAMIALGYCYELYKDDYNNAMVWYKKASASNNPTALYNLAIMYEYGKAVKQDKKAAFKLFEKSANQHYTDAEVKLGNMYLYGIDVDKNAKIALNWYQKAANKNDSFALYQLGLMYEKGVGCHPNVGKAKSFYEEAAKLGNTQAQLALTRLNKNNTQTTNNNLQQKT